jgi:hypothetical protein
MTSSKRLAAVLRIRQIQERGARGELAVQRRRHRLAEIAERRTWTDLDGRASQTVGELLSTAGPNGIVGARLVADAGIRAADTQRDATQSAAADVVTAMDLWTVAARRVEGMERLAERIGTAEVEERQRLAANEIDDLVLARFGRNGSVTE